MYKSIDVKTCPWIFFSLDKAQAASVHHYSKSFQGFSAKLTPEQARKLAGTRKLLTTIKFTDRKVFAKEKKKYETTNVSDFFLCVTEHDGVVSVFESKMNRLHTTHSWDFLGIDSVYQYNQLPSVSQSNVIVGVVDGGMPPSSFCDIHTRAILQVYRFSFYFLILYYLLTLQECGRSRRAFVTKGWVLCPRNSRESVLRVRILHWPTATGKRPFQTREKEYFEHWYHLWSLCKYTM